MFKPRAHPGQLLFVFLIALVCVIVACSSDDDDGDAQGDTATTSSSGDNDASSSSSGDASSSSGADTATSGGDMGVDATPPPPFGQESDVTTAGEIWTEITGEDFENTWSLFPGTTQVIDSMAPHTNFSTVLVNATAEADATYPDGSIIVKVNLEDDQTTVNAYTVMKRIDGFDAEIDHWFWAKYDPSGELLMNPAGVPLAGAVGKGGAMGCVPCHSAQDDHLFLN